MKLCKTCGEVKAKSLFNKNSAKPDGLSAKCKDCNKSYLRDHYQKNKKYYSDKRIRTKNRYREDFYDYLLGKSCLDCGNSDIRVLEFDHREDKLFNISQKKSIMPIENLMNEINKCDILCANCHRIRTSKQLGWYKDKIN